VGENDREKDSSPVMVNENDGEWVPVSESDSVSSFVKDLDCVCSLLSDAVLSHDWVIVYSCVLDPPVNERVGEKE